MENVIKKGVLMLSLIILMISYIFVNSASAELDLDIANAAEQLQLLGLLVGKEDGDLALDDNITRAEMATLVLRVTAQENAEVKDFSSATHTDIIGHWGENYIKKAVALGYMKGYSDLEFGPNDNITYAEVVTLMIRLIGEEKDLEGGWPDGQINKAKSINLIKDETIFTEDRYSEKLTRGMVTLLLYNTMILNTNTY